MRLLKHVKLTDTQKEVLVLAATGQDASVDIPSTSNHQAALKFLSKVGAVSIQQGTVALTPVGVTLGQQLGLVDDSGRPSDTGNQLIGNDGAAGGMPDAPADDFAFDEPSDAPTDGEDADVAEFADSEENEEVVRLMRRLFNRY